MAMTYGGVNYYPITVSLFDEIPMGLTEAKFGMKGIAAAMKLLCKIYKENGYYLLWGKETCTLFTSKVGKEINEEEMQGIVDILLDKGFFNKESYEKYQILTSEEIQKVWLEATKRRKRDLSSLPYMLVKSDKDDDNGRDGNSNKGRECMQNPSNCIQDVANSPKSADNFRQSIVKQNKALPPLTPQGENGGMTSETSSLEIPGYAYNKQTHNMEGLLLTLDQLHIIDPNDVKSILRLSDYGRLGGYVWKIISSARWSMVASKGPYIISALRKGKNRG